MAYLLIFGSFMTLSAQSLGPKDQKIVDPNAPAAIAVVPHNQNRGGGDCMTTGADIPDNDPTGLSETITISSGGTVEDLNISLDVTHTWVGDIIVTIEHNGTTVTLMDRPGVPAGTFGCSDDNISAVFDDEAGTSTVEDVCPGTDPGLNGDFLPMEALSAFDGMDYNGDWTLTISDNATGDTGTLDSWCLIATTGGGGSCDITLFSLNGDGTEVAIDGSCAGGVDLYRGNSDGSNSLIQAGIVVDGPVTVDVDFMEDVYYFITAAGDTTVIATTSLTVPTLGEWGMMAFLTLMLSASLIAMRRRRIA
jgi:hypothetical protein